VPAVGDEDVGQGVTGGRDVGLHLLVGHPGQHHLEHADRVPPVGDRDEDADAVLAHRDVGPLGAQHPVVPGPLQAQRLGVLGADRPRALG
jgi:hypothetical protein